MANSSNTGDDYINSLNEGSDDTDAELDAEKKASNEFAQMFETSLKSGAKKRYNVGDKVKGEILVVGKEEVYVSLGSGGGGKQNEGVISRRDLVDAEGNVPHKAGDKLDLFVTGVKGGNIYLSPKPTSKNLADDIEDAFDMELALEGRVAEVCNGGFRVSIKGKLAFCPISQMDIRRIEGAGEEYVGQKFEFRVTKFEEGGRNIVVSRRRVLEEEGKLSAGNFASERKAGDIVPGKIARLEKFGAFVELAPGIDGLAHVSELAWSRVADPADVVKVGQQVQCKILKIETNEGRLRISLSLKQAGEQPWDSLSGEIAAGQVAQGKVTRLMKFGAFVELKPGVEGLIPMSEMSYTQRVMNASDVLKEGEVVTVMIKDVDATGHRISLSLKDAGQDPWALIEQKFPVGSIITGKLTRREAYGLFIQLEDGITGLLPKSKANENPEFAFDKFKINDSVTVQVAEIRAGERRISLQVPKDPGADDWKGFVAAPGSSSSGFSTLADKLKAAMEKGSDSGKKKK